MPRVFGLGELLWDLLPTGAQVGGAPANFSYHAGALGAEATTISRIGDDALGRDLLAHLHTLAVDTSGVQIDRDRPTGTVAVAIDADGQPQYDITRDVAWDWLQATPELLQRVAAADAICFGTLAQRAPESREAIRRIVGATPSTALRILDVNLRQDYWSPTLIDESLRIATILKVNDVELPILATAFGLTGDVRAQLDQIMARWDLHGVALTRGDQGSLLRTRDAWSEHGGVSVTVADTIGAGDAFTAAMTMGLLRGWSLDDVNAHANAVAGHVASCAGGTPPMPSSLRAAFQQPA